MPSLRILSAAEQVAKYLQGELARGVRTGKMPGGATLARELGVGRMTVDAALELLEKQDHLLSQGPGRSRLIVPSANISSSLKIAILPYLIEDYGFDFIMDIQRLLQGAGHTLLYPKSSISDLGGDVNRIARLVKATDANAWIIIAGSKDVLSWFTHKSIPAFALFGRRGGLAIPSIGPGKEQAYRSVVKQLVNFGHSRIALVTRPLRRLPEPGAIEKAFLDELKRSGIQTSSYNLPDWDGEADSLDNFLDSMFRFTPPTALLIDEPPLFFAVQHLLARRGIIAPEKVSLVCTDWDPYFKVQRPSIAHMQWDSQPWVRRVTRWANNISKGKTDLRQSVTKVEFIEGESIGPVP